MKTKKVVINDCFGGFCLSPIAQERYLELIGKKAYFFENDFENDKHMPLEKGTSKFLSSTFTVPNPDDFIKHEKKWYEMTAEEKEEYNKIYKSISFYASDLKRDDPLLIQVVEELGEKANGSYAQLKIVEIPEDVEWEIEEYDGSEHIAEKHQTWS